MPIIRTIKNEDMHVDPKMTYAVEETDSHYPHWGWLIAAVLLFWPAAILWLLMGMLRKKYYVGVEKNGFTYYVWLDKDNYNMLSSVANMKSFKENKERLG